MKRTISGTSAFSKIMTAVPPSKTASYTPIAHNNVISAIRSEIGAAGYIITDESYRSSNNGEVALGNFKIAYKSDPDIELAANFVNSYNKMYAFRFNLGGMVKVCSNGMMINNNKFGAYKRVHKGAADLLAKGKISSLIADSGEYWDLLIDHKQQLKDKMLTHTQRYSIIGEAYFNREIVSPHQMSIIKSEMTKPSFDYKVDPNSAWALYNHMTLALKDTHPATFIQDHTLLHEIFDNHIYLSPTIAIAEPEMETV
jgi:hypothetical protein